MTKNILTTNGQIEKLNKITKFANEAANSDKLRDKAASVTLYSGLVEFYVIQTARLVEQIILKAQLAEDREPNFQPREDSYFYDKKISARQIVKVLEKDILPFRALKPEHIKDADRINLLMKTFIKSAHNFLNERNIVIHHIGNPKVDLETIERSCENCIGLFYELMKIHKILFDTASPYRFSEKEIKHFYGDK